MGDFAADTLRDSIESGWALSGNLSKTATDSFKETVQFFAHPQIMGNEVTKAVEVQKINTPESENELEYPDYIEVRDVFVVTVRYRLDDSEDGQYDNSEADIEDMTEEVRRIIKTVYSPSAGNGDFHRASWQWENLDTHNSSKPELVRRLVLTLSNILSKSNEVFDGYGGVLTFDTSESVADSKPVSDYIYTEVHRVRIREGFTTIPVLNKDTTNGLRVPHLVTGMFSGEFTFDTYTKKSDVNTSTVEALDNIYKLQATTGQHPTAVLLHANTNNEDPPATLTSSSFVKITSMEKISDDVDLVQFSVRGVLVKPSTYTVS